MEKKAGKGRDPERREASDSLMVNFLSLAAWRIQDTEAAAPSALTANQLLIDIKCQIKAPNPGSPMHLIFVVWLKQSCQTSIIPVAHKMSPYLLNIKEMSNLICRY